MANLSQNDRNIIEQHPLGNHLNHLQEPLRKAEQDYRPRSTLHDGTVNNLDSGPRKAISQLLSTLAGHEAPFNLRSKTRNIDLASELYELIKHVRSGRYDYEHYRALSHLVVNQASDVDIWNAVFDLIITVSRSTPPPTRSSFTSLYSQTRWSFNTSNFIDSSEYRKQVDHPLREELLPNLRLDIPNFVDAVFGQVPQLNERAETIFSLCQKGDTPLYTEGSGWVQWPQSAKEESVLEWLQELMGRLAVWVHEHSTCATISRQIYEGPDTYLDGSSIKRKMDVGFTAGNGQSRIDGNTNNETDTRKANWSEILVVGELKSNPVHDGQGTAWIDLATYTREVFRTQDRRFVLGFTLCGSRMRLWHFDRSGSSGSSSFDINQDGLIFTRVMLGYYLMTDKQLGLDPTIQGSEGERCIEITRDGQAERLILTALIKRQPAIVARGTICWRAYRDTDKMKKPLIIKDSWQYEERPEEGLFVKEATNRGVENIARYYHHETVHVDGEIDDTLYSVPRKLMEPCGRTTFKQRNSKTYGASALESQGPAVAGQMQPPLFSGKRSSSSAQLEQQSRTTRSRSSLELKDPVEPLHNRVHRRIVTQDAGKDIYKASSLRGIINGFLGAINGEYVRISFHSILLTCSGHESLLKAGILHRDISFGNIMLTENEEDGFLIDLDLAVKMSNDHASGAPSKTGTKVFMAIGALLGEPHSFMHDLESFFWVLFWVCIHYDLDEKPRIVRDYEKWNYVSTKELANAKRGLVSDEDGFNEAFADFTPHCTLLIPCIQELWTYIFPNGKRWRAENKKLYSQIQGVLDKARRNLKL